MKVVAEAKAATLNYHSEHFELLEVIDEKSIFKLSTSQQQTFLRYYHDPKNDQQGGHLRLANFMQEIVSGFNFRGNTYTAFEAMDRLSGNCLSLAILTTALAKLVNIDVSYQKVNSAPIYTRYDHVMTLSSHVRTELHDPDFSKQKGLLYIFTPKIIIDYFPQRGNVAGKAVSTEDFIAMYYQNKASDALLEQQLDSAYSLITQALRVSPFNPQSLNTLAVLFKYAGHKTSAERVYKYAVALNTDYLDLISNYIILLEMEGRLLEVQALRQKIDQLDDQNPYRWYDMANRYFQEGDFRRALKYYQRAVDIAPYLHEGYFYLAKTYHQLGKAQLSEIAIKKALEMSYLPEDRHLYQAKMLILDGQ